MSKIVEAVAAGEPPKSAKPAPRKQWTVKYVLSSIASLRLTVILFVLSFIVVLSGTLAQVDEGNWTAVERYFRSAFAWIPLQIFFPRSFKVSGAIPFPGGWLLGGLLLINLLAAHIVRFKLSWKRSGILLIHSGLVIMMLSELITGLFAVESRMSIAEGECINYVDEVRKVELAITDSSNTQGDDVVVIPGPIVAKGGSISNDLLPVDLEIIEYMKNSDLKPLMKDEKGGDDVLTSTDGVRWRVTHVGEESGISSKRDDAPAMRVIFKKKGTKEVLATHLLTLWFYPNYSIRTAEYPFAPLPPQQFKLDGKTYAAELRYKRTYKPYTIYLKKFTHKLYPGTTTPKEFASDIRLLDPSRQENRQVVISMNSPLRYATEHETWLNGETFYQSGYFHDDSGTVLQIVRNPSWIMPYASCFIVALGMIIHFGIHLAGFLGRRVV